MRNSINFKQRKDLGFNCNEYESIFIEISRKVFNTDKNMIIAVIYRAAGHDFTDFLEYLNKILLQIKQEGCSAT